MTSGGGQIDQLELRLEDLESKRAEAAAPAETHKLLLAKLRRLQFGRRSDLSCPALGEGDNRSIHIESVLPFNYQLLLAPERCDEGFSVRIRDPPSWSCGYDTQRRGPED